MKPKILKKSNLKIKVDKETKTIVVEGDGKWNFIFNAPETSVTLNLKALNINTEENISLMAGQGKKYVLLNTTEDEYKEWLSGKLQQEISSIEETGCRIV